MKKYMTLGLVGLLGCNGNGDSGRLEGSGTNPTNIKIEQLEMMHNYLDGRDGPFLFLDYGVSSSEAIISVGNASEIYFEDAGTYNGNSMTAQIDTGNQWNNYDGTWYFHNDLMLEHMVNCGFPEEIIDDFNSMFQKGTAVICETPYTEMDNIYEGDICLINGVNAPDSYENFDW
jgi:hypothetical protein